MLIGHRMVDDECLQDTEWSILNLDRSVEGHAEQIGH